MPTDDTTHNITLLLNQIGQGDSDAQAAELLDEVYRHLRKVAQKRMGFERTGHTLEATELVHEAYLRMTGGKQPTTWANRAHFFYAASEAMRRILIEHARKRGRQKRGGDFKRVASSILDLATAEENSSEILALDEAFQRLEAKDPRAGQIVRLRFFAGLSVDDTAQAMGISRRTVIREWTYARAWLYQALAE